MRALFFWILSFILIFADHESQYFHHFRMHLDTAAVPFYYAVNLPVHGVESVVSNVATRKDLLKENTALKTENMLLQAKLEKMIALQADNKTLLALLQSSTQFGDKVLEADVVAVELASFQHQVVINKGKKDGVYVGQPVLDAYGVLGQVVATDDLASRVMLITDKQSAIPLLDSRSQTRVIASGDPQNNLLNLLDVPQTADFQVGDALIASGLGGRYPYGYPVAQVISINKDPDRRFSTIVAKPLAHLQRARLVLLVWPNNTTFKKQEDALLNSAKMRTSK